MVDDPFDDDLFAPRKPAPIAASPAPELPPRRTRRATVAFIGPRWPTGSFACDCGARDEVLEPAPARLDCWGCKRSRGMTRYPPRFLPPPAAGRRLTAEEAERVSREMRG